MKNINRRDGFYILFYSVSFNLWLKFLEFKFIVSVFVVHLP